METNRLSVKIAGPAGEGILSAGHVFARACARGGLHVVTENERPSLIRGGHNQFMVRAEAAPINSHINLYNLLLALDKKSIEMHANELSYKGGIIYDSDTIQVDQGMLHRNDLRLYGIPMRTLMSEIGAGPIVLNVIALGAAMAILNYDPTILETILKEEYGKHPEALEQDLKAVAKGREYVQKHFPEPFTNALEPIKDAPKRMLINGLQAFNLGAVKAGVAFLSQYPMTPSTGIIQGLSGLAEKYRIAIVQTEDEIASMNMAIGAGYAGVRALTATSGGGFALMNEALSLAGMTETPLVTVLVTRGNPATGLPTRTEQSDMLFVLNSGHGEFPHVVMAPSDPKCCYTMAQRAFNVAEKYQTPVTVLFDRHVAETFHTIDGLPDDLPIERGEWAAANAHANRYEWNDETGVSPRVVPGMSNNRFVASGNEHDPTGLVNDDRPTRTRMMDKRWRKMDALIRELPKPELDGSPDAPVTIVTWGSTKPIIDDARAFLKNDGIESSHLHLTYLQPFHSLEVGEILRRCRNPVVIENNQTAQLAQLIRMHTSYAIEKKILQYDGWPFAPEDVAEKLRNML